MSKQPTVKKIAESMDEVLETVHALADHLDKRMDRMETKMNQGFFELQKKKVDKEEFRGVLEKTKSDISSQIDGFITLHQKVDLETVALRSRCDRIEAKLDKHGIA